MPKACLTQGEEKDVLVLRTVIRDSSSVVVFPKDHGFSELPKFLGCRHFKNLPWGLQKAVKSHVNIRLGGHPAMSKVRPGAERSQHLPGWKRPPSSRAASSEMLHQVCAEAKRLAPAHS